MTNLLTVVAKVFSYTLIFLLQNVSSFCYFLQKYQRFANFKIENLTLRQLKTSLSLEQLGPEI